MKIEKRRACLSLTWDYARAGFGRPFWDSVKLIPGGRWRKGRLIDWTAIRWEWVAQPRTALELYGLQKKHGVTAEIDSEFAAYLKTISTEGRQAWEHSKAQAEYPYKKTAPWSHQKQAFWFAATRWGGLSEKAAGGSLLALDMGTGKTKIAIDLIRNFEFGRTLIVCPAKIVDVWPYQFDLHWDEGQEVTLLPIGKGRTKDRASKLEKVLGYQRDRYRQVVVILNYEATRQKLLGDMLKSCTWDCIVLDECHRIKDPRGVDSKYFASLGEKIPCRLGLTGTPMPNSPIDIFAQGRFIDPSVFGRSFASFRSTYCVMGGFENREIIRFQNHTTLQNLISRMALQVKAEDVLDLPSEQHIERPFELEPRTRKAYQKMENEFVTWINEEAQVTASNVLVRLLKLQEITGGFIRDPESSTVHEIGREKRDALKDLLDGLPVSEPVVIFARFSPDLALIHEVAKELGRTSSELSGARNDLVAWQRGESSILATQISAGKEGIDLTRACHAIYYSIGYSPGEFDQSVRRLRRPGQTRAVRYYHLVAKDTIDRKVRLALRQKKNAIEKILSDVRRGCARA